MNLSSIRSLAPLDRPDGRRRSLAAKLVCTAALLGGCTSAMAQESGKTPDAPQAIPTEAAKARPTDPSEAFPIGSTAAFRTGAPEEYRLQAGDRLSAIFSTQEGRHAAGGGYTIGASDVIAVIVQDRPDLTQHYRVNPDGSLHLVQLGTLQVLGWSLDQLRAKVRTGYRELDVKDSVSIGFVSYNTAVESFINKLTLGGASREPYTATLGVDGTANFPLIGFVKLDDLSLQEANAALLARYRDHFKSLDVTLRLETSPGHVVTLLGEVLRPGVVAVNGSVSALAVLGSGGGYTTSAKTDSIMTVQRRGGRVYVNKFDVETNLLAMANLKMVAGDFIFVPRSTIANVNIFIDQYLRRNIPFNFNISGNHEVK